MAELTRIKNAIAIEVLDGNESLAADSETSVVANRITPNAIKAFVNKVFHLNPAITSLTTPYLLGANGESRLIVDITLNNDGSTPCYICLPNKQDTFTGVIDNLGTTAIAGDIASTLICDQAIQVDTSLNDGGGNDGDNKNVVFSSWLSGESYRVLQDITDTYGGNPMYGWNFGSRFHIVFEHYIRQGAGSSQWTTTGDSGVLFNSTGNGFVEGWGNIVRPNRHGFLQAFTLNEDEWLRIADVRGWFTWTVTATPDNAVGIDGDFGLDSAGKVWHKEASVWVDTGYNLNGGGAGTAATTTYDNTTSGLAAEQVQAAIDELVATKALIYHAHQAGIEKDDITNQFPLITVNKTTSRVAGYTLEQWRQYKIVTQGTVDFTAHGAANNNAGTYFTCTHIGVVLGAGDSLTESTLAVASGKVWMYDDADMDSTVLHTISAATALTFIPNEPNYVCADRLTNSWVVLNSQSAGAYGATVFDYLQFIPYLIANYRTGSTSPHNQVVVLQAHGEVESMHQAKIECGRYDVAIGALRNIGCTDTTLALTLSGGNVFAAFYKYEIPAVSAATMQFKCLWLGGSNWSYSTNSNPVLVNSSYNPSGSMAVMTDGYWANMYVWRGIEGDVPNDPGHIYTYYSQEQYATLELANAAAMPISVPPLAEGHAVFVGCIPFQKGQTTGFAGRSAFNTVFAAATPITVHNDLAGLNLGEYKHLTADDYARRIINISTSLPVDGVDGVHNNVWIKY